MKNTSTIFGTIFLAASLVSGASPAFAQFDGQPSQTEGALSKVRPLAAGPPTEPVARADELRLSGKCPRAIPLYSDLAAQGVGFEIAQYGLSLCLFETAKTGPNRDANNRDGMTWMIRAANGGFARAQLALITILLDGAVTPADPVEAGKWSLLYRSNAQRIQFGLPGVSTSLQARLDSTLTDKDWNEAQARATALSRAH